ncbi:MAG: hypothetical protein H6566_29965 [Lewinellaceae bacterium]|nr:hypothetical protein [Lewinellaceae bacterium]
MKPQRRFINPGDRKRSVNLDLNRAEAITLLNSLLDEIEAFAAKGESIYHLDRLAEKLEASLRPGDTHSKRTFTTR